MENDTKQFLICASGSMVIFLIMLMGIILFVMGLIKITNNNQNSNYYGEVNCADTIEFSNCKYNADEYVSVIILDK